MTSSVRYVGGFLLCSAIAVFTAMCCTAVAQGETTATGILQVDEEVTSRSHGQPEAPLSAEAVEKLKSKTAKSSSPRTIKKFSPRKRDVLSTETLLLATWDGGKYTNQDLSATLQLRRPPSAGNMSLEEIVNSPGNTLGQVIEDLVYEQVLYRKALEDGVAAETPEVAEKLRQHRETVLNRLVYERLALPLVLEAERTAARDYYEANKDRLYSVPQQLTVRAFRVPLHTPYVVQEGDTLESVAEKISKDPAAVARVLRDDPLKYPRAGRSGKVPMTPLKPGEKLLVPVSGDEATSAGQVARQARELLASGEYAVNIPDKFPQVELAYDGKAFVPDLQGMIPELSSFIESDEGTSISDVIKTPWGFSFLQIADRQPTRTLSYEEVEEQVFRAIGEEEGRQEQSAEAARQRLFDQLSKKHGLKLNEEALKRKDYGGNDPLTGSTPLATAPDFTYTLDEYLKDLRPAERSWAAMTFDERVKAVKGAPAVLRYLFQREAEATGLDKSSSFVEEMKSKEIMEVTSEYLRRRQEGFNRPTEEELREYYQQHLDQYTSPSRVTVREITRRVNFNAPAEKKEQNIAEAKRELAALKAQIKSKDDFEQLARRHSQALATRSRGGLIGTVASDFRGESFQNQIAQLEPGEISDPFVYGSEVVLVRLDDREPPRVLPFEEVRSQVLRDYLGTVPAKRRQEFKEAVLRDANFDLKL